VLDEDAKIDMRDLANEILILKALKEVPANSFKNLGTGNRPHYWIQFKGKELAVSN